MSRAEFRGHAVSSWTPAPQAVVKRHADEHGEDEEDDLWRTAGERCDRKRRHGRAGAETANPPSRDRKALSR